MSDGNEKQQMFIHEILEAWVGKAPDNIAILFEGRTLTYEALNSRANQLARHLRTLGVGPEIVVGICLERCPDLVVALFGVLKAGGACLPLDPGYPPERLEYMLNDTHADFVLGREAIAATRMAVGKADAPGVDSESSLGSMKVRTVLLDRERPLIDRESTENPHYAALPNNLALIFYTSGSTGSPKAVMWEHGRREVHTAWEQKTFRLTEQDRHLLKAPIGFTLLAAEVLAPLLSGGQLIIVPTGLEQDVDYLTRLIAQHQITSVALVPSMLQALIEHDHFPNCTSLREVRTIGEALGEQLLKRFFCRSDATLTVMYGTTEAPGATYSQCDRDKVPFAPRLGTPLPGKEIYLLDDRLDLVGAGEQGEICIGGSLARGYMGRPDLTAEKFIPHPFSRKPGARLYRTGDFGRYLPNGDIKFVGRTDHQFKIRGFRVEPAEIESAICEHPGIGQAVVTPRESDSGDVRLIAYLTATNDGAASSAGLRGFLKDKLPSHMIPAVFVTIDAMPLTRNGKIDRSALPDPSCLRPETDVPFVPASSPLETELTNIWAEVLEIDRVGIHDNFFDLGGHSLAASRVISRVVQTFNFDLSLKALFDAPTVAEMARVIQATEARNATGSDRERMPGEIGATSAEEVPKALARRK